MPIFEYQCKKCGQDFEEVVFHNEKPLCPYCYSLDTEQQLSLPCLHIEGSGSMSNFASKGSACGGCSGGNCSTC